MKNSGYPIGNRLPELLNLLREFEGEIEFENYDILHNFIEDIPDEEILKDLSNFVDEFNIQDEYILSQLGTQIELYLEDMISNNDLDIDFSKHIEQYYYPDANPDFAIDTDGIESEIYENLDSFLDGFNISVLERIDLDKSIIVSNLDINDMAIAFMESYEPDYNRGPYSSTTIIYSSSDDDIDAIFER